ncbi:MAG: NTP transferase domain-containing protein [Candidatus Heimdallarchaeota archaeon]|nr:NTP transferase domain-containing protein [Candidatus Heimdallarchaeota archaeon]
MKAIILAAGLGSRLAPLTKKIPKPILPIKNIPIIEKQIIYLKAIGVKRITIVIGHLAKQFDYLTSKYSNIHLIFNEHYADYNNFYSMYIARKHFTSNTFVLEGDIYLKKISY